MATSGVFFWLSSMSQKKTPEVVPAYCLLPTK